MRFDICLLLNITLLAIITPNNCVKTLTICDQMHKSSKTRFDYAFTMRPKEGDEHYIIIDGYGFQIYNHTDKELMIYDGIRSEKSDDSVLAFAYKETTLRVHAYDTTCYYKANIKKFKCHVNNNLGVDYAVNYDLFECESKTIDLKRVIAYHPQSYSDDERNEILLVERVVDQTNSNILRKVWTSYWPNPSIIGKELTCAEEKQYSESGIIPRFLSAINKSLEITAILPLDYNEEKSAIILFYVNESHKYCITTEAKLSPMCQSEMLLKDYLKYCDQNLTKTTITTYKSETSNKTTETMYFLSTKNKSDNKYSTFLTTVKPKDENGSKLYIIIIGSIFLICSVCMIFMLCYICYAKHLIRKSEENRKQQKKYYKYRKIDSKSTKTESSDDSVSTQSQSDSESTAKTTGFEISDEDVNTFNENTSNSDETIENKGPKQLMIWKKN